MDEDATVSRGDNHVESAVGDELVLLHVDNGRFFKLEGTGRRAWELLDAPATLGTLVDRLAAEFRVDRARCLADVRAFCDQLVGAGLLRVAA